MKKALKTTVKVVLIFISAVILFLVAAAIYNSVSLTFDEPKIKQKGTSINVDGYNMNIYTEGQKKVPSDGTIVLLSGAGIGAPIYDYKVLYSKLSTDFRVAAVEKFGYGYSDVSGLSRDVKTLVEQNRKALTKAGEEAPYILMPHSMSALEAIYWAGKYPEEVKAIIGLDMAVPSFYKQDSTSAVTLMKIGVFFGLHRLEALNPVSSLELTDEEYEQNKLLIYRNSLNDDVYRESQTAFENAATAKSVDISNVPVLMFSTNYGGSTEGKAWMLVQDEFAAELNNCVQIKYDCGHNLHYYKSNEIVNEIQKFLKVR